MMKKIYLLFFLSLLCLQMSAQYYIYTYTDDNGITWKFTVSGTDATIIGETQGPSLFTSALNIPATVSDGTDNYTVTAIANSAFLNYSRATSLTIPDGVTTIGGGAFYNCSGFTGSLTIPNSVKTIESGAFNNCSGFTGSLTIGNSVTTIESTAFRHCSGFTGSLTIPNSVTTIGGGAFENCSGFTGSLTIGNSVTTIESYAFNNCSGFTGSLTIPNSVTTIESYAFNNCFGFTGSLTISNSVTTIPESAFENCSGFTGSLTIPNSVTTIGGGAFYNCSGFTGSLTIPNSVTTIGYIAFGRCRGFTGSLTIGNSVTTIGRSAFNNCSGFTGSLTIPNSVTTIGEWAFYECSGFTGSLTIGNSVTTIGSYAFNTCSGFTGSLIIPNSVTTIGSYAFGHCYRLTGLTIGNSVTTIGEWAFYECSGFTGSLTIPNSVTTIGSYAFYNCSGFTGSLTIPNSVRTIGRYAFYYCGGLTGSLTISSSVTAIEERAFFNCFNLESVTFENGAVYTYTSSANGIFYSCNSLKYIDMRGLASPVITTIARAGSNTLFSGTQPYTMVYLPAGSSDAEAGEENFVIGNACDKFVVYDYHYSYKRGSVGCDYPILRDFNATQASYANRSFTGTACKTLCLPYPATLPAGMRAYELKKRGSNGQYYNFVSIGDGGTVLEANKPYLLRIISGGGIHTFDTKINVQVKATPEKMETQASADATSFFGGTTMNIDNATAAGKNLYNLYNNKWLPITTADTKGYLRSFRAYVRTEAGAPSKQFALVLDEDETTGIEGMEQDVEQGEGEIFTIDGRSVGRDINALKSGEIYIRNGKKFYKF